MKRLATIIKYCLFSAEPERVFAVNAAIFGILFMLLTPPFQSPDENRHFYRAYHISQGSIFATKMDGRVGGYLPKKVKESLVPFSELRANTEIKTSREAILQSIARKEDSRHEFVDFPSMAVYTPLSYVPQAIGIRIARLFSDSTIIALYAGRLMTLLCWIIAVFFAIRITPMFKWLIVALALLPMSLSIHSSLTADMMTNATAFLFLAFILKHAFSEEKQSKKQFLIIAALVFLVSSLKFLYSPLLLLFLLIPMKNFTGKKQFFLRFGMLSLLALVTVISWPIIQGVGYVSYNDYNPAYRELVNLYSCADVDDQLAYILSHGTYIFEVIGNSLAERYETYTVSFIGNFGWLEVPLSDFWVNFGIVGLIVLAICNGNASLRMSWYQRGVLAVTFASIFVLIIVSQSLIWTCVGSDLVTNLQGRYLIPIAPLFFFLLYHHQNRFEKFLPFGVVVFSSTLLVVSALTVYNRFYVPNEFATETVSCDHESGELQEDFGTSNPKIFALNGFSRSTEKARSGIYSSKLSGKSPHGTLISFDKVKFGDIIEVEAWRNGPNGLVVVSNDGGKRVYEVTGDADAFSDNGWHRMYLSVTIPASIIEEKVSVYLTYPGLKDSCYFDDVKITLKRLN